MNPKCFIFAIGGTGSRVLRSLIHLLAAGVKPGTNNFDIVPIIIDPHHGCADLQRTALLLDWYKKIREISNPNGFFSTKICTLEELKAGDQDKQVDKTVFTFKLKDGTINKFSDYIGYSTMDPENKALVELLFSGTSKDNNGDNCDLLDLKMDIGFVGNPNVGSVVLNQIVDSAIFDTFTNNFQPNDDDRIFIISSIFGGTGAAGFPCLLKNIREGKGNGSANLKVAKVGAVSVLPYFNLGKNLKSAISYADFIAKTKSALYYYEKNVTGNKSVNVMYYIGDRPKKEYDNDPGYNGQKGNLAHFVELASALAVINFLSMDASDPHLRSEINTVESVEGAKAIGKAVSPVCNEFSIQNNVETPSFFDFKAETYKILAMPLSQFALFKKYMEEQFVGEESAAWQRVSPKLEKDFLKFDFYRDYLSPFFSGFGTWLKELKDNNRGFAPFNIDKGSALESFIIGGEVERKKVDYQKFVACLNEAVKKKTDWTLEKKLMDIFHVATNKLLDEYYGLTKKIGEPKK